MTKCKLNWILCKIDTKDVNVVFSPTSRQEGRANLTCEHAFNTVEKLKDDTKNSLNFTGLLWVLPPHNFKQTQTDSWDGN